MLERDKEEQSESEQFDNLCYDQRGKKPAELPAHILKGKEQLLPLAKCILCIIRYGFTKYERDFLVAFVTARGDRNRIAESLNIDPRTVDNNRALIVRKIKRIAHYLIKIINSAR